MAENIFCTRARLSATACGFARSLSSQAGEDGLLCAIRISYSPPASEYARWRTRRNTEKNFLWLASVFLRVLQQMYSFAGGETYILGSSSGKGFSASFK